MSGATAELDLFGIQKEIPSKTQFQKLLDHGRSFRGIQSPIARNMVGSVDEKTAPLTIFYNGTVSIFHLPGYKAEMIMKYSEEANVKSSIKAVDEKKVSARAGVSPAEHKNLLEKLNGDLPIARKRSLQRFLEKRKERITTASLPYSAGGPESTMDKKTD